MSTFFCLLFIVIGAVAGGGLIGGILGAVGGWIVWVLLSLVLGMTGSAMSLLLPKVIKPLLVFLYCVAGLCITTLIWATAR